MSERIKFDGKVYTPNWVVSLMLDFADYRGSKIIGKHVIDNSCGDGAFLKEIVRRYCNEYVVLNGSSLGLAEDISNYIHGLDIDSEAVDKCRESIRNIIDIYTDAALELDIFCADALEQQHFFGAMDYVFGNPPYVRVHNLGSRYKSVKEFAFTGAGMTDLYIVFFELGIKSLAKDGVMCLITPSSWFTSVAGGPLRSHIEHMRNLESVIDFEHKQLFDVTTYTAISLFRANSHFDEIKYHTYSDEGISETEYLSYKKVFIKDSIYLTNNHMLDYLRELNYTRKKRHFIVKNGLATLADGVYFGDDIPDSNVTIDILKASTGKWTKGIFPYDDNGRVIKEKILEKESLAYKYLVERRDKLPSSRDNQFKGEWYEYGRTQALLDVSKPKYAINNTIKNKDSLKINKVKAGQGVYSGLYILTSRPLSELKKLLINDKFVEYIAALRKYRSGGYYTFSTKDVEIYLNYNIEDEDYGQQSFL